MKVKVKGQKAVGATSSLKSFSTTTLWSCIAALLIVTSVRVAEPVKDLISQQLHHADVAARTSAILRFSVLWRFRYQVWPRLEYGAHIHFKVPSSPSSR